MARIGRPKGGTGQTKQKIFETAIRLMQARGYEKVSINDICREMGLTKGAFYAHYKSKDQLVMEQIIVVDRIYREELMESISKEPTVTQKLRTFCRGVLHQMEFLGKDLIQTAYRIQLGENPGLASDMTENRELYRILEEMIAEGQRRGEFRKDIPASQLWQTMMHNIRGLIYNWCLPSGQFELSKEGDILMNVVFSGLVISRQPKLP